MLENIIGELVNWIESVISTTGPVGIMILMAIESV